MLINIREQYNTKYGDKTKKKKMKTHTKNRTILNMGISTKQIATNKKQYNLNFKLDLLWAV